MMTTKNLAKIQRKLEKRLKTKHKLLENSYRGRRTFVVIPGLNHPTKYINVAKTTGLKFYEERMLFFLFLLKNKRTRIIYVTSKGFNKNLFEYHLSLISSNQEDLRDKFERLVHIEIDGPPNVSLIQKILQSKEAVFKLNQAISDPENTFLRCYNPTDVERALSLELEIPLFGSNQKFDFIGTKSGGRKVFKLSGANIIPGYSDISNFPELCLAMAKLAKKYPETKRLMIKENYRASGKGNAVFYLNSFLTEMGVKIRSCAPIEIAKLIEDNFKKYVVFQNAKEKLSNYITDFNNNGGIVELYIEGNIKYSPSTQVIISSSGKFRISSTHEQVLGGPDKQVYLGCTFPAMDSHRRQIIKKGEKIASWLAKRGIVGNFAIDYVVIYSDEKSAPIVYPIEINLRKGGTTHPFRIASYMTGAKYYAKTGILKTSQSSIFYKAMDFIQSEKYKGIKPNEIIELVSRSRISFSKNLKKGILIYMPGMIEKYGRFGAICIGHSSEESERYFKRLIRLINTYVDKKNPQI